MVRTLVLIGAIVGVVVLGIGAVYAVCLNSCYPANQNSMIGSMMGSMMDSMMGSGNMMSGMMSDIPQDVIIKIKSSQQVSFGKESFIKLLVLDKNTKKPLSNAQIIVGIERGAPMSTMNMIGPMFKAENIGNGEYVVKFTLDNTGYYTMHTHVIPSGKSMHSMMENHMDIGIVVK